MKEDIIEKLNANNHIIADEALRRYFVTLSQYGYYDYQSVYRILALLIIPEFREEFACFWTSEDESIMQRVLNCLYCSVCAIPSPTPVVNTEIHCKTSNRRDYAN